MLETMATFPEKLRHRYIHSKSFFDFF